MQTTTTAMGIDPVFSSRSVLFNPQLSIGDWYNTSTSSPAGGTSGTDGDDGDEASEVNVFGKPYGFFKVPGLKGYEQDGFPVGSK